MINWHDVWVAVGVAVAVILFFVFVVKDERDD